MEIVGTDDYARFFRDAPYGNGGNTSLAFDFDLGLAASDSTSIEFDVNPVYSDVGDGAGWHGAEYPAEVRLTFLDASGVSTDLLFCYNYRGGWGDTLAGYVRVASPY